MQVIMLQHKNNCYTHGDEMTTKVSIVIFAIFLFSITKIALADEIDINRAKVLLSKAQYKEALTILSPCLSENLNIPNQILEDCLYLGENAATKMEEAMWHKGIGDGERDKIFKSFGIKPEYNHHNGPIYNHDFFHSLNATFPASKYKDEVTYILIQNNFWQAWENQLIGYLKEFPKGHYAIKAKLDLAHLYDNLWDVLSVEESFYREDFSTGNFEEDLKLAEDYRARAINLYETILKDVTASSPGISEYELKETQKRVGNLRKGKHWNRTWIIND